MIISCIDTETTGLDKKKDRIIQLSVTNFESSTGERIGKWNWYIKPSGIWSINPGAEDVHHISQEYIMEHGRSIKEIFPEFMEAISSNPILTYNGTTFDIIFIQKDLERESLDADLASHTYIDAFDIERRVNSNKLSEVYMRYYGKPFEDAHDSSADVDATIDVYMEQQRRYSDRINPDTGTSILAESQADVTRTTTVSPEGFVYMDNDGIMKFRVGKYKEYPVYQVCINDPGYIKWLFEPRNGDNVISNITKRAIRNMYYMEQNKESNK